MIQEWDNGAKQITDEKDIKKICDAFNHIDMKKVSDYDTFLEQAPCGGEVYIFQFELKNLQKIVVTYTVGQRICYNGNLYQTTNIAIKDFWDLDYRIYEWNPERLDLHSLF